MCKECKDCKERHVGCHGECEAYIAFTEERQKVYNQRLVACQASMWETAGKQKWRTDDARRKLRYPGGCAMR